MENKNIKFQIKIGVKDLYHFLMGFNYKSFGGILGLIISAVCLIYLAVTFKSNSNSANLLFLFLGLLFTVIQPLLLLQKAAQQATRSEAFRNPLEYELGESGFVIRQQEQEVEVAWDAVVKVVEDTKQILVYTSRVNACIWPKEQLNQYELEVKEALNQYVGADLCRWKSREKKGQ